MQRATLVATALAEGSVSQGDSVCVVPPGGRERGVRVVLRFTVVSDDPLHLAGVFAGERFSELYATSTPTFFSCELAAGEGLDVVATSALIVFWELMRIQPVTMPAEPLN